MVNFNLNYRIKNPQSLVFFLGLLSNILFSFSVKANIDSLSSKIDTLSTFCKYPSFSTQSTDVTSPSASDGYLRVYNIYEATHYEIIEGNNTPFDFGQALPLGKGQTQIEIKNISNPTGSKFYRVRFYNAKETCFTEQTIIFRHVNFASNRDYVRIQLVQGVDNSTPKLDEIVTFTTIIQNKGTKESQPLEVRLIQSINLETVHYFAEQGQFTTVGNIWKIGALPGGKSLKLVIRAKVKSQGLNYLSSYISKEGVFDYNYDEALTIGNEGEKRAGTSCTTVPIGINNNEVYNIVLKQYKGVKWYYKDASGNFSEINEKTNPNLAVINPDSSLTVKMGGEFSFSKKVGDCNISSCCPIIVETCSGPPIVVDSVYCNATIDSYNIIAHLENDKYSIIEKVFFAMSNLNFPVLTNYLSRINALPLTTSSGFVTSLGNSKFKIENIPAFMPNVTLVSSDLSGKCRNIRIVNAPNCTSRPLGMPLLDETVQFKNENKSAPAFVVISKETDTDIVWFEDELATKELHIGKKFKAKKVGTYYVAYRDKKTKALGPTTKAYLKELLTEKPGKFGGEDVCDCDNPLMLPFGDVGDITTAKAYPNPVSDILTVEYRVPFSTLKAELHFTNVNGRMIKNVQLEKSKNEVKVETYKWVDGLYFYSLIIDGVRTISQKIVVSHQ
ncbi:MAG: T9SS type A sorting domain-containing protein [Spirosomataceae bacterium]|jgi:hypothetical protein